MGETGLCGEAAIGVGLFKLKGFLLKGFFIIPDTLHSIEREGFI